MHCAVGTPAATVDGLRAKQRLLSVLEHIAFPLKELSASIEDDVRLLATNPPCVEGDKPLTRH